MDDTPTLEWGGGAQSENPHSFSWLQCVSVLHVGKRGGWGPKEGDKKGPFSKMEGGLQEAELRWLAVKQLGHSIWRRLEPDVPGTGGRCGAGRGLEQEKRAGPPELAEGALRRSRENIWPPSAPLPVRHYYFCKLEQQIFSQILESALCAGTVKHRV